MKRTVKSVVLLCGVLLSAGCAPSGPSTVPPPPPLGPLEQPGSPPGRRVPSAEFTSRVLAVGLQNPFEILWGPDGELWVTERTGKTVSKISVSDGSKTVLAVIGEVIVTPNTQDGLLGMALHPELLQGTGNDYVYLAYTYGVPLSSGNTERRTKITRWTYDASSKTLGSPVIVIDGLPGSTDHNSGRLVFGPDQRLYYTIGDQGNNQFASFCRPIRAQQLPTMDELASSDWSAYQGKLLRLNLDGSIPEDNPVLGGVRSHIFSYGHRNAQGLAFGPGGVLYQAEQGPKTDDEVNIIEAGGNYGWPHVAGFQDGNAYVYANWSASEQPPCAELKFSDFEVPAAVPQQQESDFTGPGFRPPVRTFYTVENGFNFKDPVCAENDLYFLCWPTIAPSSLSVYAGYEKGVPELADSLLLTSLKQGAIFRVALGPDGMPLEQEAEVFFRTKNRYRDIAIAPTGRTIYVATDTKSPMLGPDGRPALAPENPGAILEFSAP